MNTYDRQQETEAIRQIFENPANPVQRIVLPQGGQIYGSNPANKYVHYILQGQIHLNYLLENQRRRLLTILGPSEWFGIKALAQTVPSAEEAVAVGPTVLLRLSADQFLSALQANPAAAVQLCQLLAWRSAHFIQEITSLIFDDIPHRLVKAILRFGTSPAAQPTPNGIHLNITHEQLALFIGTARETVSLALTQLRHQHLVRTGRNKIYFDPVALGEYLQKSVTPDESRMQLS